MSEPEALPAGVHPEVALLPWYVNGTLGDREREQVSRHLESCDTCRGELLELESMRTELSSLFAAQPGPSAQTARSIRMTIAREGSSCPPAQPSYGSWLEGLDHRLRSLFVPRWVPTIAVLLLVTQMGLVLWVTLPIPLEEEVTTRSLAMHTTRFIVSFQRAATEEQIRLLLRTVHGRIVDGPTPEGLYTLEVLAADDTAGQQKLDTLLNRTDVIRSANPAQ